MFNVQITKRALKDLQKLPEDIKKRIIEKLKTYSVSPFDYATKLKSSEIGSYRFHIGDYRVIFDVDGINLVVLRVGHRKEIYR